MKFSKRTVDVDPLGTPSNIRTFRDPTVSLMIEVENDPVVKETSLE